MKKWQKVIVLIYFALALSDILMFIYHINTGTGTKITNVLEPVNTVLLTLCGLLSLRNYRREAKDREK